MPPTQHHQVDLVWELAQPWQAGGEIVVVCRPDGWPQAGRRGKPPRDQKEEMARRRVAWTLREREGATLGADGAFTPTLPGRSHAVATALGDPGASGEVCILVPEAAPAGPGSLETKGTTP